MKANIPRKNLPVDCSYSKMVRQQLRNGTFPMQRSEAPESLTFSLQQQKKGGKLIISSINSNSKTSTAPVHVGISTKEYVQPLTSSNRKSQHPRLDVL